MSFGCCCECKSFTSADYVNATLVADYASPPGADIYPYPRPSGFVWTHTPDCAEVANTDCGTAGYPLCGPWPIADRPTSCGDVLRNQNCYTSGATTAVVSCVNGHKVVQAEKQWHGKLGFETCPADCDEISVRYLTIAAEWSVVGDWADNTLDYDASFSASTTVGQLTGIATQSGCSVVINPPSGNPGSLVPELTIKWMSFLRYQCGIWSGVSAPPGGGSGDDWTAQSNVYGALVALQECQDAGGTVPFTASNGYGVTTYNVSDTSVDYVAVQNYGGTDTITFSGTLTLSIPYYGTEAQRIAAGGTISVESDLLAITGEWLLTNDAQLPWRDDGYRGLGVKIHYSEDGAKSPDIWAAYFFDEDGANCDYVDPNAGNYDGSVVGSPFDAGAGIDRCDKTFAWEHPTYECCSDSGACGTAGCWSVMFYGASSGIDQTGQDFTDALIPGTASDWTDNYYAGRLRPGSWWSWNTDSTTLTLQKQCEGKVQFESYNLFGPCGAFRHQMDTSCAACITGFSAEPLVAGEHIYAGSYAFTGLSAGDKIVIYGGTYAYKVFTVASVSAGDIELGAEDTDVRNVADAFDDTILFGWTSNTWADVDSGTYGIVGKLRVWKRSTVPFIPPSICGKIAVVSVTDNGDGTSSLVLSTDAKYLQVGDLIDFVSSSSADTVNYDNLGAGVEVLEVTDSTHFKIDGYDVSMTGYVKSHGAPLAKWNTSASRRNFVWQEWLEDNTTGGFQASPDNVDDRAATHKVLGSTPDSDTDSQWRTEVYGTAGYPFPDCPMPTKCGGNALVIPIQFCTDPLWLQPITCGAAITVCAPEVEAMTTTRYAEYTALGAPALPDGCVFNVPTTPPSAGGLDCASNGPIAHEGQLAPWIPCVVPP